MRTASACRVVPVVLADVNAAVSPFAAPVTERATAPVKPPLRVMVTTTVDVPPCANDGADGFAVSV